MQNMWKTAVEMKMNVVVCAVQYIFILQYICETVTSTLFLEIFILKLYPHMYTTCV